MNRHLHLRRFGVSAAATLLTTSIALATPVAPGNLKGDVNGLVVDLSWDWGNAGERTLFQDFEDEQFPPAGWDLERGYQYNETGNWARYSFSEEDEGILTHSGLSCAILMIPEEFDEDDPTTIHQDEWLIVNPGEGAEYMDFWYYIHPELLDVGGYQDFPDHYYVKISRDGGDTWTELWDGRWDIENLDTMRRASLFLGEPADADTLVAFQAVSAEEESLYFLWIVDDVEFFTSTEAAARPTLKAETREVPALRADMPTHRSFIPGHGAMRARRAPQSEWLNAGQTTFRVYLDDEIVGDYIKTRHFTDFSNKEKGSHTYRVMAWNEATDTEYAGAELSLDIDDFTFLPPADVKGYWQEKDGKYSIDVIWADPEGDMHPAYYNIYVNDKSIGRVDAGSEYVMGQFGLAKGIYKFGVEAVYEYPEGSSECAEAYVFPGTVPSPVGLKAEAGENGGYTLSWVMPEVEDFDTTSASFSIYRGDELLGRTSSEMNFTDAEAPAGHYRYSVHAEYAGGEISLPATADVENGEPIVATLPMEETFDNGHLPLHWKVELNDPNRRVKDMYMWRFDNWFDLEVPAESGITEGFASISCVASGFNLLESYLYTPTFLVPEDANTQLSFCRWFYEPEVGPSGPALCEVQASADGGATWEKLFDLNSTDMGAMTLDLDAYAGKQISLRWAIMGRASGILAVDNVMIKSFAPGGVNDVVIPADTTVDILTVSGITVRKDVKASEASLLPAGIYLMRSADGVRKIVVK